MRIDAHQHFWKYTDTMTWITPAMSVIRKDFMADELEKLLTNNSLDGSVAVQADQTEAETDFLLELAEKNSFIKAVVGWTDLRAANIADKIDSYRQHAKLKGFRHVLQTESPEFMLHPDFIRGIAAIQAAGFVYDILVFPEQLTAVLQLIKRFPEQAFVIDHIAKPAIKKGYIKDWEKNMRDIAAYENVYCKISGMVTEADWQTWKQEDFIPYLDKITAAFGTNRLMYGSDWPVCLVAASYEEVMGIVKKYYANFSKTEQQAIFGENANQFYHLS